MKVAAYCRVSSDLTNQEESYLTQVEYFTGRIRAHADWELVEVYAEKESARTIDRRTEFQRMIGDAKAHRFSLILTKSVSRFSRNVADCVDTIRTLRAEGVHVYFEEQKFSTDGEYSELILTMLAAVAQMESESISENMKQINRVMNERGTPIQRARYGYVKIPGTRRWEIESSQAERVRLAFAMAGSGYSITEIARKLTSLEKAEGSEKVWKPSHVRAMLLSENYIGDILTNKTITVYNGEKRVCSRNKGEADQFYIREHHEPIVGEDSYRSVKEMLEHKAMKGQRRFEEGKALRTDAKAAVMADPRLSKALKVLEKEMA